MRIYILITIVITVFFFSTCDTEQNTDNRETANTEQQNDVSDNERTKDTSEIVKNNVNDNSNTESSDKIEDIFFEEALEYYKRINEYLTKFEKDQAPSGKELISNTADIGEFLTNKGTNNKKLINTKTFKSFYSILNILYEIIDENEKLLNNSITKHEYIKYYHNRLNDLIILLGELKENISNKV